MVDLGACLGGGEQCVNYGIKVACVTKCIHVDNFKYIIYIISSYIMHVFTC